MKKINILIFSFCIFLIITSNCQNIKNNKFHGVWYFCEKGHYRELYVNEKKSKYLYSGDTIGILFNHKINDNEYFYFKDDFKDSCYLNFIHSDSVLLIYEHRSDTLHLSRLSRKIDSSENIINGYLDRRKKCNCHEVKENDRLKKTSDSISLKNMLRNKPSFRK